MMTVIEKQYMDALHEIQKQAKYVVNAADALIAELQKKKP